MARVVADRMKDNMGQTVLVENRPGAQVASPRKQKWPRRTVGRSW